MPWTCPDCQRVFARNKQAHSCESYDLEPLFIKSEKGVRVLYDSLVEIVGGFGQIDVRVGPYNVSVRNLSTFLVIIPEKDHLTINFITDNQLDEFPVYQSYHQSKNRWSNHVKIESPEEIDEQLINWLQEAYKLTGS